MRTAAMQVLAAGMTPVRTRASANANRLANMNMKKKKR
jgi:hypothetical protein